MLALRRGVVVEAGPDAGPEQRLVVQVAHAHRPALADVGLLGPSRVGDDVIVNVQALDLGLGSGGFDIVHANLTRGLEADPLRGGRVMKLNYTGLQHGVEPVEGSALALPVRRPVAVCALHGQLAPVAWALSQACPGARLGYVQSAGGALPGGHSTTVRDLRRRGLLAAHITAGTAFGGEQEAVSVAGALHHGLTVAGWDVAVCAPGPGIVGSESALGHGGMAALDSGHAALALGCDTVMVARMSSGDSRRRHRGLSHHTATVLDLLLAPVRVALPEGEVPAAGPGRHRWCEREADLAGYTASGLPASTMGRSIEEDPLFFAAALAGGLVLSELIDPEGRTHRGS